MFVDGKCVNVHRESIFDIGSPGIRTSQPSEKLGYNPSASLGTTSMAQANQPKKVTAGNGCIAWSETSQPQPSANMRYGTGRYVPSASLGTTCMAQSSQPNVVTAPRPVASLGATSITQESQPRRVTAGNGFTFDVAPSNRPFDPSKTSMFVDGKCVNVHRESIFDIGSPSSQNKSKISSGGYPVASSRPVASLGATSMTQESKPRRVTAGNGFTFDVAPSNKPFDPSKTCMFVDGKCVNVHRDSISSGGYPVASSPQFDGGQSGR